MTRTPQRPTSRLDALIWTAIELREEGSPYVIDACQAIVDEFYGRHSAEWLEFDYLARLLREPALETQRADEEIADAA